MSENNEEISECQFSEFPTAPVRPNEKVLDNNFIDCIDPIAYPLRRFD
jgi:hypothetical protein